MILIDTHFWILAILVKAKIKKPQIFQSEALVWSRWGSNEAEVVRKRSEVRHERKEASRRDVRHASGYEQSQRDHFFVNQNSRKLTNDMIGELFCF